MRNSRRAAFWITLSFVLCALPAFLAAQDVNRDELESTKGKKIEFVNYVGPHKLIDTKAQIRGIGEDMAKPILAGKAQGGDLARYGVIHAADPSLKTGFDADIIFLGKGAGVDHVRNLRWIISGYLVKAYGYSVPDADLLATFITIYNAVYRGDTDYFASRYKPVVLSHLTKANAGLSLRWDEWADRSRIVIPLGANAGKGNISSIDTTKLTEEKVTEELRKTDGKGVEERKDIVELKEREVKEGEKAVEAKKEGIKSDEAKLAEDKAALEAEKKALDEAKAKAAEEDKGAGVTGTLTDKGSDAEAEKAKAERDAAIAEKEKAVAEKEKAVAENQKAVEAKKDDAAAAEADVAKKQQEIKDDRAKIAEDQQKIINAENGAAGKPEKAPNAGLFLEALSTASPYARILSLDLDSGSTLKKSDLNTILIRSVLLESGTYYCIAGSTAGTAAVRLVSVSADTLQVKAEGKDDIFQGSLLAAKDGSFYAVIVKSGRYYLGRFDKDLALKAQSAQPVHPFTALEFRTEGLAVQLAEGGFAFLGKEDLKSVKVLK